MTHRRENITISIRLLALFLCATKPVYSTSIAIYVGHDWAIISTDGVGMPSSKDEPPMATCKIACIKNLCFTAAGAYGDPSLGWNVFHNVEALMVKSQDIDEVVRIFAKDTPAIMQKVINIAKAKSPVRHDRWIHGGPVLSTAFVSVTTKGSKEFMVEYHISPKGVLQPTNPKAIIVPMGAYHESFLGYSLNMVEFSRRNTTLIDDTVTRGRVPMVRLAEKLVQIEIDAAVKEGRPEVGPPIATLWMLPDGIRAQTMGGCEK